MDVRVRSAGIEQEVSARRLPPTPPPGGPHQWTMAALWRLSGPAARAAVAGTDAIHLDRENLLTIDGPGCWVCEAPWSEAIADRTCPGEPRP